MQDKKSQSESAGIDLLDYLEVIVNKKRVIISSILTGFVLSIIVSFLLPRWYQSTARILPPQQDNGLMGMMIGQMTGGIASLTGDLLGKGSLADLYVGMSKSETISDAIIGRYKLMDVYNKKYRIDTYKELDKHVDISVGKKDGIISIAVEDKDPKRAADIANAYVEELAKLTVKLNYSKANQDRIFIDERLAKTKFDLAKAEEALKAFQSKNKALDITEQAKGTIKGVADLEAQLAVEEVKLASMRLNFADTSQEIKNQRAAISSLKSQVAKFEGNRSGGALPGIGSVPALGQEYLRLMREFKIQETLLELLTKQSELAKLNEANDATSFQILQKANMSDKKKRPKKSLIVVFSTMLSGIIAVLYIFTYEAWSKLSPEDLSRIKQIKSSLLRK